MPAPRWMSQAASEEFSWSQTLGGTRGVIETSAPGLIFVIVYVATHALVPTLVAASAVAVIACIAATGRGEHYFAWGIVTNLAMAAAFALSVLARRSLVGFFYAMLTGLPTGWQREPSLRPLRRRCALLTWMWAGLFGLRVAVQAPLWAAGAVAALGIAKLALGLPLFALGAWATWWGLRDYSSSSVSSSEDGDATASRS